MTQETTNGTRFTAEVLRTERLRIAAEKASDAESAKRLAQSLRNSVGEWQGKIVPRIRGAVESANSLSKNAGIALNVSEVKAPPPVKAVKAGFTSQQLPGLVVMPMPRASMPLPLPGTPDMQKRNREFDELKKHAPTIRFTIDAEASLSVSKINYRNHPSASLERTEVGGASDEFIDHLMAEFLNDGVLGLPAIEASATVAEVLSSANSGGAEQEVSDGSPDSTATSSKVSKAEIAQAIKSNHQKIDLAAASMLELLDAKLSELRQTRPNNEETIAANAAEIEFFEDLKRRTSNLIEAIAGFLRDAAKEDGATDAVVSLADGAKNWWSAKHVEICERSLDAGLFGLGVTLCWLAGAGGAFAALAPLAVLKGAPALDAVANAIKSLKN